MWQEIGQTVRKAMDGWGATLRLALCVLVLTAAAAVLMLTGAR